VDGHPVIVPVSAQALSCYLDQARREGVLCRDARAQYYACFEAGDIAGFGAIVFGKRHDTLKSAYVLPHFRGRGFYKLLLGYRIERCLSSVVVAHATRMSLPVLMGVGFEPVARYKNGVTKMRLKK
jgi:GNAT superfamily N-acetyltransferase